VIDVNSGSFTRSATARETVLWTNCEAATEIARQLRLRNIAGVIIVDFIDMDSRRDQLQLLEHFNKVLKSDKARPQIAQLSELGLVELTRKRQGQNIYELFGRTCSSCGGLGHLVHLPDSADENGVEIPDRIMLGGKAGLPIGVNDTPTPERSKPITLDPPSREEPTVVELDASSNLQDLDLLNHPSYQDIGVNNNNNPRRRRRRRLGDLEPIVREEEDRRNDLRVVSNNYNESRSEVTLAETGSGRTALPERNRSSKAELIKSPAEPPEVISVEMTKEEQEMYALMGISPLLVSSETVKNPRTAIVTVRLPGADPVQPEELLDDEEPDPPNIDKPNLSEPELGNSTNTITVDSKPEQPIIALIQQADDSQDDSQEEQDSELIAEDLDLDPEEEEVEQQALDLESEEEEEEEEQTPVIRRRRRRSSALSD
jgi:ribonuclease E